MSSPLTITDHLTAGNGKPAKNGHFSRFCAMSVDELSAAFMAGEGTSLKGHMWERFAVGRPSAGGTYNA